MKFARKTPLSLPGVTGIARMGTTAEVLARLKPGDVAIIDHDDLDRDTAAALVETGVRVVVNAAPFIAGRHVSLGAEVLAEAGVLMIDGVGTEALEQVADGQQVRVVGAEVHDGPGEILAKGRVVDMVLLREEMAAARAELVVQMDTLARATGDLLRREQELLVHGLGLPSLETPLSGRAVVVVARAEHADLQALRMFVREQSPALVATGEVADELLAEGWVPDIVVIKDAVPSSEVLDVARDVVIVTPAGVEPPLVDDASVVTSSFQAPDLALLLAEDAGADLVVAVGLQVGLEEFLDQPEQVMAGAFATRLRLGPRLIDAAAVHALYAGRPRPLHVALVALAGLAALLAALSVTRVGHGWVDGLADTLQGLM